jgi:hypothetical protein
MFGMTTSSAVCPSKWANKRRMRASLYLAEIAALIHQVLLVLHVPSQPISQNKFERLTSRARARIMVFF